MLRKYSKLKHTRIVRDLLNKTELTRNQLERIEAIIMEKKNDKHSKP